MPRPRADGVPASAPNKAKLTEAFVRNLKPRERAFRVWDTHQRGLLIQVQPTGRAAFKCVYSTRNRKHWITIGPTDVVGLADARKQTIEVLAKVAGGRDPRSDRGGNSSGETFAQVAERYVNEYSQQRHRSWEWSRQMVTQYLLPKIGSRAVATITKGEMRDVIRGIKSGSIGNAVLTSASAIFSWAEREELVAGNPCRGVERNPSRSRERVLADEEFPIFWDAFSQMPTTVGSALKTILLTGQRPGEIRFLCREHISGNWWHMPALPDARTGWKGTKAARSHRVWLTTPVLELIAGLPGPQPFQGAELADFLRRFCSQRSAEAVRAGMRPFEKVTPHDLRRTFATLVTRSGFTREAMDRVLNHAVTGVGSVYDRYGYETETREIAERVATEIMKRVAQ